MGISLEGTCSGLWTSMPQKGHVGLVIMSFPKKRPTISSFTSFGFQRADDEGPSGFALNMIRK
jgi:hypothetical protein